MRDNCNPPKFWHVRKFSSKILNLVMKIPLFEEFVGKIEILNSHPYLFCTGSFNFRLLFYM